MPLSEKARIEVYLPDAPNPAYRDLLEALEREFTFAFGGATTVRDLDGSYLSRLGIWTKDRINLIYTDTPFPFARSTERLSAYADRLYEAVFGALQEESVLVAVHQVFHGE